MKKQRKESEYSKLVKSGMSYKQASKILKERKVKVGQEKVNKAVKEASELAPSQNIVLRSPRDFNVERGRAEVLERGMLATEFIKAPFWVKYLKPKIEQDISNSIRIMFNSTDRQKVDEARGSGNYGRRILSTVLKWIQDMSVAHQLIEEEEKKK